MLTQFEKVVGIIKKNGVYTRLSSCYGKTYKGVVGYQGSALFSNHQDFPKSDVGSDTLISMAGSDLDEVLNWSSKGEHNSMEFWQKVIKK